MSKSLLSISLILFLLLNFHVTIAQINKVIDEITNHPNLNSGRWSIYAVNLGNGKVVANYNSDKIMSPASNLKLLTSAVALDMLGSDYVINTFIEYDGKISSRGVLDGNLFIRGEGDPTLGSNENKEVAGLDSLMNIWVDKIKNAGIISIKGDIVGDDSYLDYMPVPGGWNWDDMGNYYAAGTSGLCINENSYKLYFKPADHVGDPAKVLRTEPEIPNLSFINHMRTGKEGSGDNGYIYGAPWQWQQQLEGTIPAGVDEFKIEGSLPDPAKFTAEYFRIKLQEKGIVVSGDALTIRETAKNSNGNRKIIYTTTSPPLKNIVYQLNKRSVNLIAEQLLKILGKKFKNEPSRESGIEVIEKWLEENGFSTDGLYLLDGSGLSNSNRLTTKFLVDLLVFMIDQSEFDSFYNSFPIAGDPDDIGTMKKMCKNSFAAKNLRAKTGTNDLARAHSGYVRSSKGDMICFSMIANDFTCSIKKIDKLHEKIMIELANLN